VLAGADATRAHVLRHLGRHPWLHASCHGVQNLDEPSEGGLLPHDWRTSGLVTVADLADQEHVGGRFAFLSACQTATGGIAFADEVMSVAAALVYGGWQHVVSTQWTVWDSAAASVTRGVYTQLVTDGVPDPAGSARALHATLRRMQDEDPKRPSVWAPFVHLGL
jgi:CHAT domain-containing protein